MADLDALRGRSCYPTWVVGGDSWGANLALVYALTHPDRVDGLSRSQQNNGHTAVSLGIPRGA